VSAGLLAQYVAIGLIVPVSVAIVFRKLAPQLTSRWLAAASIRLANRRDSRLAQALGRRLQPKQASGSCADGCSTCGACGPKKPPAIVLREDLGRDAATQARASAEPVPLHFRPRSR